MYDKQMSTATIGSAGGYPSPAVPQEPRLIRLIDGVFQLCKQHGDHYTRLVNMSDRMMGSQPRGIDGQAKEQANMANPPLIQRIEDILQQMARQGSLIEQEVQRLETLG